MCEGEELRGGATLLVMEIWVAMALNSKTLRENWGLACRPYTWINGLSSTPQQTKSRVKRQWMLNEMQKGMICQLPLSSKTACWYCGA